MVVFQYSYNIYDLKDRVYQYIAGELIIYLEGGGICVLGKILCINMFHWSKMLFDLLINR